MELDIRAVNGQLDRLKGKRRNGVLLVLVFLSVIVLAFLFVFGRDLVRGTISPIQLVGLLAVIAFLGVVLGTMPARWKRLGSGAQFMRCDDSGCELVYIDRHANRLSWSDPDLSFELHDFSQADQSLLLVGTPYFVVVRNSESALTPEAYSTILAQVQLRGLVQRVEKGSRQLFGARSSPMILQVRGRHDSSSQHRQG